MLKKSTCFHLGKKPAAEGIVQIGLQVYICLPIAVLYSSTAETTGAEGFFFAITFNKLPGFHIFSH